MFRPEPAVLAPLLLALWGAGGLATAQPADAAPGGARTILVGPQAPTAPTVQQTERLQRQAAPRARFLGEAAPGYAVNTHDREAVRLFYASVFASSQGVSSGWTGSVTRCDPGSTSVAYQQATQRRINWFRAMAGVPAAVVLDEGFSRKAQQTALMMSAQRQLSHFPDASWACYSPEGAEGAANSNLGLGSAGAQAVAAGYMQDFGDSNAPWAIAAGCCTRKRASWAWATPPRKGRRVPRRPTPCGCLTRICATHALPCAMTSWPGRRRAMRPGRRSIRAGRCPTRTPTSPRPRCA
ncbi:CAP domain-containing protein [Melaminivora jejuensis]|uniref:CAP domain-containing protein n=1 Tax=Melaminivora jejuensis TaxID=1267217 RepID=UPI001AE00F86|nr:CAP domain-containing protein [Melaminivora jejuensis]